MERQPHAVELFVRSLSPSGATHQQERILERLDELATEGHIDDYEVTVWGERVVPDSIAAETPTGERVLDTVEEFQSWATAHGVAVDRFYPERTVESAITGEEFTAISLPVVAMAEYVDDRLHHVTPHEGETVQTVLDRLDALDGDRERSAEQRPLRLA
jgi:hypothetical protein